MSKVICDVCGTTYPETASQCPICGAAKAGTAQTAAGETAQSGAGKDTGYTPVKGGRFSKTNVRKRSTTGKAAAPVERRSSGNREREKENSSNRGLIIVVVILLLLIIAVVAYIGIKFFDLGGGNNETKNTKPSTQPSSSQQTEDTGNSDIQDIPCDSIQLSNVVIELDELDASWLLTVETDPLNTTEEIFFTSSDESVVTVNDEGVVTARGAGQAVITVTCGEATAECRVVCSFQEETEPSDEPTEPAPPTEPVVDLALNSKWYSQDTGKYDVTIGKQGGVWHAYVGSIPVTEITWTTDDPSVATIDANGKVTAVGLGKTEIHGQYMGKTVTAIVRCSWETETQPPVMETEPPATDPAPSQPPATQPEAPQSGYYMVVKVGEWASRVENGGEFTINQGQSVVLELRAADGTVMTVSWSALDGAVCSTSGNTITGVGIGSTEVACKAPDGSILSCLVRVKAA